MLEHVKSDVVAFVKLALLIAFLAFAGQWVHYTSLHPDTKFDWKQWMSGTISALFVLMVVMLICEYGLGWNQWASCAVGGILSVNANESVKLCWGLIVEKARKLVGK